MVILCTILLQVALQLSEEQVDHVVWTRFKVQISDLAKPMTVHLQAALQLSEEQVAHMVRARREFLASLKPLLQQRRALNDIIRASIVHDCDSNPAVSLQHSKVIAQSSKMA